MSTPVDEEFLQDYAQRWLAAWNSHDTERLLEILHPEIEWEDLVFWPEVIHGHADMRTYIDKIWEVMPDVHFEDVQVFTAPAAGRALCLFRQSGHGPKGPAADQTFSTYGCDIFLEFRDGRLKRYLAQYEISEMMRQLGMLPARDGRVGGAYLMSLLGRGQATRA
ncbi:nuclear transport factor 2 family protein [Pseudonocardia sp. NPDC049154]|uniref:nuclear transport factor 2 family protein n=1 Tax=Pseudonocardia sp. NPDC049154 TaxID=3155501 RepID=UPI0033FAF02F